MGDTPESQGEAGGRLTFTRRTSGRTGGLPGVTATGVVVAGAAAALKVAVGRLREPDADDLQV